MKKKVIGATVTPLLENGTEELFLQILRACFIPYIN